MTDNSDPEMKSRAVMQNPALDRLKPFLGEWSLEFRGFHADPSAVAHGHASFAWLEGGAFLLHHAEVPDTGFPRETAIIGPDDMAEAYGMLYFDSRGVSRIYRMTFSGGIWTLWRDYPGFLQRFHGTFSDDGNVISARWEKSSDGSSWEHDFDLTYTRTS